MAFIYKITNKINGKFYIGFTSQTNPLRRFNQHLNAAKYDRKNNQPIIRAIQKYGYDNFEFKVLLEGEDKFLLKIEEPRLIKELSPHYNATLGGDGILGYKHTEETKLKFLSRIGRKESEEHKKLRALKIKEAHKNQMNEWDSMEKLKDVIECNERLKFSQNPYEYLYKNDLLQYNFLIKDTLQETKLEVLNYVYGKKKCEYCGKPVNRLLHGWKGIAKTCDKKCTFALSSKLRTGEGNPSHRMTMESKNRMKEKMSIIMKTKILNGEFTPKSNNYKCHGLIEFILEDELKKVRSMWELFFWLMNPKFEYEKIRLKYYDSINNKDRIYITDFYDNKTNTLYEVKPKKYQNTLKDKLNSAELDRYNFKIIDENYFKNFESSFIKNTISNSLINKDLDLKRLNWIESWKK